MKAVTVFMTCFLVAVLLMASTTHARKYCMNSVREISLFLEYNCQSALVLHSRSARLRKRASRFPSKRSICRPLTVQDYISFHEECCEQASGCSAQEVTSYCCLQ